MPKTSFPTCQS